MVTIYGKNVIKEALIASHPIQEVFLEEGMEGKEPSLVQELKKKKITISILKKQVMNNKFQGNHQGMVANVSDYKTYQLEELIDTSKKQYFLLLDGLEDPQNLGAILRTADASGIDGIILPKNRSVSINGTVAKVSVGAIEYVKVAFVSNLNQAIDKLKKNGFWICGTDMNGEKNYREIDCDTSLGIVIGSEGFGMSRLVREKCDYLVNVPMVGHVNSLNASVTAALLMYEVLQKK